MLNVALPKGRLADKTLKLLAEVGYNIDEITKENRKLVFEDSAGGICYFLVKPSDVTVYVENGVADIGVVGKDILLEYAPDVYELIDLKMGKCRVAVAAKNGYREDFERPLRVATKFPGIARRYYASVNRDIEIIKLNGSIELAPILGMSDVIVDIVETGTTLKENDMSVFTEITDISARLIACKASYQFKREEIETLVSKLREVVK